MLKKIFLLKRCLLFFIFRGRADKDAKDLKKILVVQTAKLGDLVCTTPVFRAIKEKYPEVKIYVLVNKINNELLADNQDVDHYFVKESDFNYLKNFIKTEKFDCACLITPNFENLAVCYLAGIPLIVAPKVINGISPYETKPYKILSNFVITRPHYFGNYAPREYLRLLEPLNIFSENTKKHLNYSTSTENKIINFLNKNNIIFKKDFIVGIAPSVANKIKLWPSARFAKIADYLVEKYQAKIIIIGGNDDRQEIEKMIGFLNKSTFFVNTCGLFDLAGLKALIAKLNLFISVDTGPIYIAEALNIPTVDILGPMDENEQPPQGQFHKIVKLENRIPQLHIMNARLYDKKEACRQIDEITVEAVIDKINELIKELKTNNDK